MQQQSEGQTPNQALAFVEESKEAGQNSGEFARAAVDPAVNLAL